MTRLFTALNPEKGARSPINRDEIHAQLDRLLDLRDGTDPERRCDDLPNYLSKQHDVSEALYICNSIFAHAAGWALDHEIGVALTEYKTGSLNNQDVDFESVGREYEGGAETPDGCAASRAVLAKLLLQLAYSFPYEDLTALCSSLGALNYNETSPFLRPRLTSQSSSFSLDVLKIQAIERVHYLVGLGYKRLTAEESVATAYGISYDTLRSWEKRLRQRFPPNLTVDAWRTAKKAGQFGRKMEMVPSEGIAKTKIDRNDIPWDFVVVHIYMSKFKLGDQAAQYRKLLSERASINKPQPQAGAS